MCVGKLSEFNVKMGSWALYIERIEMFFRANKMSEELWLPTLIVAIGDEAYELLSTLTCPDKPSDLPYSDVVKLMAEHLKPRPYPLAVRYTFRMRTQQKGETIYQYISELKKLSRHCDFKDALQENLRDQFVCGLKDKKIRQKLFLQQNLSYADAVKIACAMELETGSSTESSTELSRKNASEIKNSYSSYGDAVPESKVRVTRISCGRCKQKGHLRRDCPMQPSARSQSYNNTNNVELQVPVNGAERQPTLTEQSADPTMTDDTNIGLNVVDKHMTKLLEQLKLTTKNAQDDQTANISQDNQPPKYAEDQQLHKNAQECQPTKNAQDNHTDNISRDSQPPVAVAPCSSKYAEDQQPHENEQDGQTTKNAQDNPADNIAQEDQHPKKAQDKQPLKSSELLSDLREKILFGEEDELTIKDIVRGLRDQDPLTVTSAARAARCMTQRDHPPIASMIEAGIISPLVDALGKNDCQTLQYEAAWAITNLTHSGTKEHTMALIDAGVIPKLLALVPRDEKLSEQSVWALGNIAGEGPEARDAVLKNGTLPVLLPFMLPTTPLKILRKTVWAYKNLCRISDSTLSLDSIAPGLPYISELLLVSDDEVLRDACWAIIYLVEEAHSFIDEVQLTRNLLPRLVALLTHESKKVKGAALQAVGNMLAGSDKQTDRCLDLECLTHIVLLLNSNTSSIVKNASWAISNVLAGTETQIQRALNAGVLTHLQRVLATQDDINCKTEAAWAISNLCLRGSREHIEALLRSGCLEPFCALLSTINQDDGKAVDVVLDGLYNLFKSGEQNGQHYIIRSKLRDIGTLDLAYNLRNHENSEISKKSIRLIDCLTGSMFT